MLSKAVSAARRQLLVISTNLSNQVRGLMKTFGLVVPKGRGRIFAQRAAELDRLLLRKVRDDANCRRLMTAPGIGAVVAASYVAASYVAAIESPANFKHARDVGAWVGLTPRRFQSGEMDYDGHISRRGDERLRALLYEAATVILTRVRSASALLGSGAQEASRLQARRRSAGAQCAADAHGKEFNLN